MVSKWTSSQIIDQHRGWCAARNGEPSNPYESRAWRYGYAVWKKTQKPLSPQNRKPTLSQTFAQSGASWTS